jgi:tellurite resistance protein TehA-like permease
LQLGIENVGPGWFTSIMGTGILAICIMISPVAVPLGHALTIVLWSTATILLALFLTL